MAAKETEAVARRYFAAITARDVEAAVACWAAGGRENVRGQVDTTAPQGVRDFLGALIAAIPDLDFQVVSLTTQKDRCAVQWRARGTFAGAPYQGIAPTGASVDLEGVDIVTVEDDLIVANDAFTDGATFARQVGLLPPQGSKQETRVAKAFNTKTRMVSRLQAGPVEQVAHDVWLVRGGFPQRTMNVYLVRDEGGGVFLFDAGIRTMAPALASAAAALGGLTRIVLGHGHGDHRGAAPSFDVPVLCHPDNVQDTEGDGGMRYFDFSKLNPLGRRAFPLLLKAWDGGPVKVTSTIREGDEIAGWKVIDLPGHAPGLIGLWRESDRLALVSDTFYTLDPQTGVKGLPRVPHAAFNFDHEQARASIRKLAALEPAAAWAGHADGLSGDVAGQLIKAADET